MINKIRRLFTRVILRLIDVEAVANAVANIDSKKAIEESNSQATLGEGSSFLKEAKIYNSRGKENIVVGKNTIIGGQLLIFKYGGNIKIGDNCYIGLGTRIWSGEDIQIGDNVLISHNVSVVDTNAHEIDSDERAQRYIELVEKGPWKEKGSVTTKRIIIKDNAWVNFGAIILKGVIVGKGAIVAAGAVVTKDVPDHTVVAGNPAIIIKDLTK